MIRNFIIFCWTPNPTMHSSYGVWKKSYQSFFLLMLLILLQVLLQILFLSFTSKDGAINQYNNSVATTVSPLYLLFIGPLFEEFAFRLLLTRFNEIYIKVSTALIFGTIISGVVNSYVVKVEMESFIFIFLISVGIYIAISILRLNFLFLEKNWSKMFRFFLWTSIILFCIIHVPQLMENGIHGIKLIRAVASLVIGALVLSYARIRYGIAYSLIIHASYNFISLYLLIT